MVNTDKGKEFIGEIGKEFEMLNSSIIEGANKKTTESVESCKKLGRVQSSGAVTAA